MRPSGPIASCRDNTSSMIRAPTLRRLALVTAVAGVAAASAVGYSMYIEAQQEALIARELAESRRLMSERPARVALLAELQPVALENCTLKRFGGPHDGGYLMCVNLLRGIRAAYSYGIGEEDEWGCQVSREFDVTVHQYDCFTPARPACKDGRFVFHNECVGAKQETIESRRFDSIAGQIAANGDAAKRLLVKMDVEGAEWDALLAAPDSILDSIDQMAMELHVRGASIEKSLAVVRRL